ncbi:MAG: glycoside hydrolase family 15 [Firmicutes bacterium HGW-Firmicutes-14]|nr:MAG: glycoside hydrolase family 15 [Methanomicrobiales archaeon HGW-Methanomicrobiales-5]PKM80620.1 MAG: glycoside hydrolase family 15 [Firmicutes bacterium HGW-Firmicutes-14]
MPRQLVIGNGGMLINFDSNYNMRDLYYPYVGQWNHIQGNKNCIGVWVEDKFTWCDESSWERTLRYKKETLATCVKLKNEELGLFMNCHDTVHYHDNIYLKKIVVENLTDRQREVRLFFTHDFSIDESEVGDTAVYEPDLGVVYHYKKGKYFMANGFSSTGGIYQYATGTKRFRGAEGTWRDAEDGHLQGNPIAQGSVDSTISFRIELPPRGKDVAYYWIVIGKNFQEARRLNEYVLQRFPETIIQSVEAYWKQWVNKIDYEGITLPDDVIGLFKRSLLIIRTQVDRHGAITAANDSDIMQYNRDHYSYMWPRDGALVSYALIRAGYPEMVEPFFKFCENALTSGGFLLHKYNPDGSVGSSWHPWINNGKPQLPIQEDETALVLFALWEHYKYTRDIEFALGLYRTLIRPAGNFMVRFMREEFNLPYESYDLWEERRGIFTFTASAVYAGLTAAAKFADLFADYLRAKVYHEAAARVKEGILEHLYDGSLNRFVRGVYVKDDGTLQKDLTMESSVYGVAKFGVLPPGDERVVSTMKAVESGLWVQTEVGGIARYTNDYYFRKSSDIAHVPGNPWFICTLWVIEWYINKAQSVDDLVKPLNMLQWVTGHAMPSGVLSEQLHPYTGEPLSVAPLTWSHSAYVSTVRRLIDKMKELTCTEICPLPPIGRTID